MARYDFEWCAIRLDLVTRRFYALNEKGADQLIAANETMMQN